MFVPEKAVHLNQVSFLVFLMQNQWELFSGEVNNKVFSKTWNMLEHRGIKKKKNKRKTLLKNSLKKI